MKVLSLSFAGFWIGTGLYSLKIGYGNYGYGMIVIGLVTMAAAFNLKVGFRKKGE